MKPTGPARRRPPPEREAASPTGDWQPRAWHRSEDPRTPLWRRLLSLVELVVLTVLVGAAAAGIVAGLALAVGSLLGDAI